MAKAEASVEELVSMIERGELRFGTVETIADDGAPDNHAGTCGHALQGAVGEQFGDAGGQGAAHRGGEAEQ